MLDKTSEKVLKIALSHYNGNTDEPLSIYCSECEISYSELIELCKNLYTLRYINNYICNEKEEYVDIFLKHVALKYFELKQKEKVKYWVPIAISNIIAFAALLISILSLVLK